MKKFKEINTTWIASLNSQRQASLTNIFFIFIFVFIISSIFPIQSLASTNVDLNVIGCNYNNICEAPDEANLNCSNDCTLCNFNNVCEVLKGEATSSCPSDCGVPSHRRRYIYATSTDAIYEVAGDILNLNIKKGINYVILSWDTVVPTYGSVSWGIGDSYSGGIVNGIKITSNHEILIENLSASTTYSYVINSSLPLYFLATNSGTFTTASIPEIKFVPSIYNLVATSNKAEIILNWNNPDSKDFTGVKITRSPFFFPADPLDGKIIYDGAGTYTRDSDLVSNKKYYYSAFSYDKDLNYSPGVLVWASLKDGLSSSTIPLDEWEVIPEFQASTTGKVVTTTTPAATSTYVLVPISNFVFTGGDMEFGVTSNTVRVYQFGEFRIIAAVDRLPINTKSLILRIQDPSNISNTYLYSFTLDPTKKYFYLDLSNLTNNIYPFSIISYDLGTKASSVANGFLDVRMLKEPKAYSFFDVVSNLFTPKIFIVLSILVVFGAFQVFSLTKFLKL